MSLVNDTHTCAFNHCYLTFYYNRKCPYLSHNTPVLYFSNGEVLFQFIELKVKIEVLLNWKNHFQWLLFNTKWFWKLAFVIYLKIFLSEFYLKLQGKILFICETYIVAKSFWEWLMFESQVMSSNLIQFLSCQKLKQRPRYPLTQISAVNIFSKL